MYINANTIYTLLLSLLSSRNLGLILFEFEFIFQLLNAQDEKKFTSTTEILQSFYSTYLY
ncbi:hypothetical protein FLGSB24_07080 [Flavobacterium sp. GSB-24]|nr:hypothetical protein FLGSB24_07080 [Flavobacterium sp. GSB-24]